MREAAQAKAAAAAADRQGDSHELIPEIGSVKVRLIPPKNPEDPFYYSHSYHFLEHIGPNGKGKYVFSRKQYTVDGKIVKCPIDETASEFYKSKDEAFEKIAGKIKRKRHYFIPAILVDEPDPEKKFVILKDTSNDAKLLSKICSIMGIPYMRDVEDNWWDKTSQEFDEDAEYFDLLDPKQGYDLKIVKKKNGTNTWDVTYDASFAVKPARALTDEELQLIKDHEADLDLPALKRYEENYSVVESELNEYLGKVGFGATPSATPSAPKGLPPKKQSTPEASDDNLEDEDEEDELSEQDILNALDS